MSGARRVLRLLEGLCAAIAVLYATLLVLSTNYDALLVTFKNGNLTSTIVAFAVACVGQLALHPHAGSRLWFLQHSQHRRHGTPSAMKRTQDVGLAELHAADALDWTRACVDASHIRAKNGGEATGPSPVDRGKAGSRRHLIYDGKYTPFKVIPPRPTDRLPASRKKKSCSPGGILKRSGDPFSRW